MWLLICLYIPFFQSAGCAPSCALEADTPSDVAVQADRMHNHVSIFLRYQKLYVLRTEDAGRYPQHGKGLRKDMESPVISSQPPLLSLSLTSINNTNRTNLFYHLHKRTQRVLFLRCSLITFPVLLLSFKFSLRSSIA